MSVRETWIFPSDGSPAYKRGEEPVRQVQRAYPAFVPDMPDFVSPIDFKRYSGRAGMRDHNARHNVVSNLELKGLPTYTANSDVRSKDEIRADRKNRVETIIRQVEKYSR